MNGYFQIAVNEQGTSVRLIPPTDGGEKIQVNELKSYLERIGVPYNVMAINSALYQLKEEEVVLFLNSVKIPAVDEKCEIYVMGDKMSAVLRLYPASTGGAGITEEQIMEQLKQDKIQYGIDKDAIHDALSHKKYCTNIIIAKGKLPTAGKDATINYYFDTSVDARPELKEDGSVDFFKLNLLHHCTKGQVLAEIIPEEKGEDGVDIFGTVTAAREVKKASFNHGKNLEISEDGHKLLSMVDGHVSMVEGAVFVSDVYSVDDVSTSTGNIEYHGNIEVKGNVCENFSVKTDGNVFVNGVVEGAVIEAGGDIVIARGMHGQNKGKLVAGGNIIAKFLSAAEVTAHGFVEAEQILNSKVVAGTEVHAEAGKGLISGGRVIASKAVNVKNAGSPMGTATIIEVGSDPETKKRQAILNKSVGERSKSISQMRQVLENTAMKIKSGAKMTPDQIKNMKLLQQQYAESQEKLQKELAELAQLDESLKYDDNAHIDIGGIMYQGVAVAISGATLTVKNEYTYCRLVKKGADITSTNL